MPLENNVDRLSEDHANARLLADAFAGTEGFALESGPVMTNLVWVKVDPAGGNGRRSGRVPSLAQHPGHRDRGRRSFAPAPTWTSRVKRSSMPPE